MSFRKFMDRWIFVSGILVTLIGVIHNLATLAVHDEVFSRLPKEEALVGDLFFVATGFTLILLGALTIYSSKPLQKGERWAFVVVSLAAAYSTALGLAAVTVVSGNFFAYLLLVVGVGQVMSLVADWWVVRQALAG